MSASQTPNQDVVLSAVESKEKLLIDFDFLPSLLDLLSSLQNSREQKDEILKKVIGFQSKMTNARKTLNNIKGLDTTFDEQEKLLETLNEDIKTKRESLMRFKEDLQSDKK